MSDEQNRNPQHNGPRQRPLPGVSAIGLWMFFLCLIGLIGVSQHKLPHVALLFCIAFVFAGQGLLRQRRWGWALTLATVFLSSLYGLYMVIQRHQLPMLLTAVVNLLLFLYLIRPEVRERMR
jgi:uncharacterized membrane protein (UPF0136 family)